MNIGQVKYFDLKTIRIFYMNERTSGENIKMIRKSLNLSQRAFGEKLGVSRSCVERWEVDNAQPDFSVMRKMKEVFGISYEEIIDGI